MDRVIMIKYGELTTKKMNRNFFVKTLLNNIKGKLNGYNCNIYSDLSRMYIEFDDNDLDLILSRINNVFGIHEYVVAYKIQSDTNTIKEALIDIAKNSCFKSFKVVTKRSDKSFSIKSEDFSRMMGGVILSSIPDVCVNVFNPDIYFYVEIRSGYSFIYTSSYSYKGLGGYPNGTLGKAILMLSGGIDSPVAGYLALKRGVKLDAVYFESIPHTSIEARNKVLDLAGKLSLYTDKINVCIVPFTDIQEAIYKNVDPAYCITIMRRMMYRITERLLKSRKAQIIVNGESIGQVASQTLTSMQVINSVTNYPVIRPVACLDKLEIIDIAKKIDTYDISILPYEDCCTIFVPKHPVINPRNDLAIEYENTFDYESYIEKAVLNTQVVTISENMDDDKYGDLL